MAHEVESIPCDNSKAVFDSRILHILAITAAYYGLASRYEVNIKSEGPQA